MTGKKLITFSGWACAAILLAALVLSKFDVSIRPKTSGAPSPEEQSKISQPEAIVGSKPTPVAPELTTEQLFATAAPSVVLIEVFDELGQERAIGSGFIASSKGEIVTNYHVIRGAATAKIKYHDGTSGQVVGATGYDAEHDVAVLMADRISGPVLQLVDTDEVKVGQKLVAIGSPLGLQDTISEGIVSANRANIIQMSVPISPGSSGGPVLDRGGRTIGIAVASVVRGQNLNFAVPVAWAKKYLGSATPRALAEISAENSVTEQVLEGSIAVPAGQVISREFKIDPNKMAFPELDGQLSSRGGLTGNVSFALMHDGSLVYACNRQTECVLPKINLKSGTYSVILDNRGSLMFRRDVTANLTLHYVR